MLARRAAYRRHGPTGFLLGVPERAVMEIMGWSNSAMAKRYRHLTKKIQRDIARRVGGLVWEAN